MPGLVVTLLLAAVLAQSAQGVPVTVRASGRVVDAGTGEPLPAVQVILLPAEPQRVPAGTPLARRAETNSAGLYVLDVPPGRYLIQVQRAGFVPTGSTSQTAPITIGDRDATFPDIRLERGGTIAGRVLDDRGRPLPNMTVIALRPNNAGGGPGGVPVGVLVQTNDLGEFRLAGVPGGRFYVMARPTPRPIVPAAATPASTFIPTYYPGFAELSSASLIDVTPGNTTNGIDVQILQAPTFVVSGVVVDAGDRAVAGAVAALSDTSAIMASPYTATSQKDGSFRIAVPSGTYRLVATIPVIVSAGPSVGGASLRFAPSQTLRPGELVELTVGSESVAGVRVVVQGR